MDNEIVGSWGLVIPEGKKPIVSITRVNDRIRFLNIYAAGVFKTKISIEVNGNFIYQDKLNMFDRLGVNNPKIVKKLKKWAGI